MSSLETAVLRAPAAIWSAAALALLAIPAAAQAPELAAPAWTVDKGQSRLGFSGEADGQAFAGRFEDWSADIRFDPANLSASSADVTVKTGSVETGDDKAGSLAGGDWFAVDMFPTATFRTTAIRAEGENHYVADGTLKIRDTAKPVSLPFDLSIDGDVAKMKGTLTLDRKDFGLIGGWQDGHVDPKVTVEVNVVAHKG